MVARFKALGCLAVIFTLIFPVTSRSQTESLDELHKKALKEGGTINFYASLAEINAEKIIPLFEKRFPGMKVNHVASTSDKLAARIIAEARGGRTIVDVMEFSMEDIRNVFDQEILSEKPIPEAAAYPANFKGSYWLANNLIFITGAWNTDKVKRRARSQKHWKILPIRGGRTV